MQLSIQCAPIPRLRPFIESLWASSRQASTEGLSVQERERMIPSGCMHIVFRFSDQPIRIIHPAIAHALSRFSATTDIGKIVEESGYSHRHFIQLFRQTVGISPRIYTRLLRFQQTLRHGFDKTRGRWIDVALEAGYADQAHFNREFRELTGISPTEYLRNRSGDSHHVPIRGQFCSIQHSTKKA
jgi:AraC-like DNA-binding protein